MTSQQRRDLVFGEFRIDRGDERLIGSAGPVKLGHKAYQVLCALIEREGRLLSKDILFESVWDGMAVSESALTTTIRELRRALGDDTRHPRYIESVYGRGYRFVAEVSEEEASTRSSVTKQQPPQTRQPVPSVAVKPPRIVVSQFEDASVRDTHPYIAAAIREEILSGLSRFREVQVINGTENVDQPGDRDYCLEATFLPDGENAKVTARVQRMEDRGIVWAESISLRESAKGSGIEKIVRKIVGAALPALDQDVSIGIDHSSGSLFDRYLMAKWASVEALTRAEAEKAARDLEEIIAEKPSFALAYPPLVRLYNIDYGYSSLGASGPVERARALKLAKAGHAADRSHVHAYTVLGFCHLYNGEFDQAQSCFEQALKRNPFNPPRLNEVATGMTYLGEFERARQLFEEAREMQPFGDDDSREDLGRLALLAGDMDAARTHFSQITVSSLWARLCTAVVEFDASPKSGAKRVAAWKADVIGNWHRPIPPGDEEMVEWFRFHHPFKGDAGKGYVDLVTKALNR